MPRVLLINPNTSDAATAMMVRIAARTLPAGWNITGLSAESGPATLTTVEDVRASASEVLRLADLHMAPDVAGVIIAAYGDPALDELRKRLPVPVVSLGEASMRAAGDKRFGVATITPELKDSILQAAAARGYGKHCTGVRITPGDPVELIRSPAAMTDALEEAVRLCAQEDGAETVIIGGGPLGEAADELMRRGTVPIIAPVPAAVAQLMALMPR